MENDVFEAEMEVAKAQGELRLNRGVKWGLISLASIVLILILGVLTFKLLPENVFQKLNQPSNTSNSPQRNN